MIFLKKEKLKNIKAVAFDIDGVMTDGGILALPDGDLLRVFNAKDSMAIRMAAMNGLHLAVITGANSESIRKRMLYCGVPEEDIYLHSRIKIDDFNDFCRRHCLRTEEVAYLGDDLPDVPVLKAAGLGVAPEDACPEALEAADYLSDIPGGKGCFRDIVERILKAQDKWHLDDAEYKKRF